MKKVITRFAPSPTGTLHIGGVRTALFNYVYAKKYSGKFLVRIEDTDRERSTKEFEKNILDSLVSIGLSPDENPINQSERGDIYQAAAQKIIDSGLSLQVDCPDLALSRHMIYKDISEENFLERANKHVEVLNKSLENIDPTKVRMHICWGNYEGPHIHDIELNKIIEIAFKANINMYLIESANPRHAHEWEVFENIKLPKDKIIIPGVIESTSNFIEHPDVVKHRILAFSKVIDPSQLMAGTDCGFSTFAGFGNVDENIVYKKLESLVIGSGLASKVI